MTALDLAGDSKTPPPPTHPPSHPPKTPPPPTKPPNKAEVADGIYAVARALGFGDLKTPARQVPQAGGPVEPDSEGGRAGGVASLASGAVSGFALPVPLGPPRFGDGPPQPGNPPPDPPQPFPPNPFPPPLGGAFPLSLSLDSPTWPSARRP